MIYTDKTGEFKEINKKVDNGDIILRVGDIFLREDRKQTAILIQKIRGKNDIDFKVITVDNVDFIDSFKLL